ncbi:MAG: aminotransferase class I/II-fold pyridoxal phosphate-dependent enzyme [Nanoarchaeota archaeon]|nr:aminotransferase class I/II-fold pyridoxal phosphate-dependent enzyme [Nanoarchaeota archaeon]
MNPQAEELNENIKSVNKNVYDMLSDKGKAIFFPKKGILAQTAEAKGKNINATIGIALEEDGSPMRLKSISEKVDLDPKDVFPYAPSFGRPDLREKWKEMMFKKNPSLKGVEISLPVVTNALTHGMSMVGYLFMDPGENVISPDLYWGNYNLILKSAYGVEFDTFETFKEEGFNVEGLKEKLGLEGDKKIVVLNFPNNPTGYTPTEDEVTQIIKVVKEAAEGGKKILMIIDDAYFGLVYKDGIYKQSIFSELAGLHENVLAVKLDGATKEDYVWGLRVGFMTYSVKGGNKELYSALESKTSGAIRGNISNDSNLSQSLVYNAFSDANYWDEKKEKYELLKKRFMEVESVINAHNEYGDEFEALPFNSGYFMCIKLKNKEGGEVRQILLKRYDTGVIALGNILRLAFSATPTNLISELFDNIYKACKE